MLNKTNLPFSTRQFYTFWYQLSYQWYDIVVGFSIFCIYLLAAQFGLSLTATIQNQVSPIWPATGISISILVLYGYRFIPSIALGAFLINYSVSDNLMGSLSIMLGNTLEALPGYYIILYFKKLKSSYINELNLNTIGILFASLFAPIISAGIGSISILSTKNIFSPIGFELFLTWWIGDMIGALVLVPFILRLSRVAPSHFYSKRLLPFVGLLLITTFFVHQLFINQAIAPFLFVIPLLIYLSIQFFNSLYSKIFIFFLSTLFLYFSVTHAPLFPDITINSSLIRIQIFIAALCVLHLTLATVKNNSIVKYSHTVLLFTWLLCGGLYFYLSETNRNHEKNQFLKEIQNVEGKILERMRSYEDALIGGKSFYSSTKMISEKTWISYIDSLQVTSKYPGIMGVGVITPVSKNQEPQFLNKVRQEIKDFSIKNIPNTTPSTNFDNKFIITYFSPHEIKNQTQGFDIGSESNRRAAAELARDTGESIITKPILLTIDPIKRSTGFIFFVPIYNTNTIPASLEARRKAHIGWIHAPFISKTLFENILYNDIANEEEYPFHLDIFHGSTNHPSNIIFQSSPDQKDSPASNKNYEKITRVKIGQSDFYFGWTKKINYLTNKSHGTFWFFIFGCFFSILIYLVVYNFENTGINAQSLADKQTQLLLKEQERVLAVSKVKSDFLANMGHEIRTPLNGIIGMINLLLHSNISESDLTKVKIISHSSESLLNLIDDILDFSKLEANKSDVHIEPMNFYTVLSDVIKLLSSKAEGKNLYISLHFIGSISEWVMSDALKLKKILTNLIGNALKFTNKGGVSITIKSFDGEDQKRFYQVEIKDTGIGLAKEALPNLFKSFSQLDMSSTKLFGGAGLGLSICKSLVELLAGKIWVESEYGKGSRFIFHFSAPLSNKPQDIPLFQLTSNHQKINTNLSTVTQQESTLNQPAMAPARPIQILVVDDNKINLKVAQITLNKMGYECDLADSGADALEKIETRHYDLVLMDCFMPEMDGFSTTQQIRFKYKDTNAPRIVAVTASIMQEDHNKCIEVGMNAIMIKPIKADLLKMEIDKTLIDLTNRITTVSGIISAAAPSSSEIPPQLLLAPSSKRYTA